MKLWETEDKKKDKVIEDFLAGKDTEKDQDLVHYDILGNLAHVEMLKETGIISQSEFEDVKNALQDIRKKKIEIRPDEEDIHTKIENLVTQKTEAGKKIHTARSRNDQVLLDTRLYMKDHVLQISEQASEIVVKLLEKSENYENLLMPGYTHYQQAMPSTGGLWFSSIAEAFVDDLKVLEGLYPVINSNPLGAAAGYGTNLPIDRDYTTQRLGFDSTQVNSTYTISSRGKTEYMLLNSLNNFLLDINRFCTDITLFNTQEFRLVSLDSDLTTGSSIMPQKNNPDTAEVLKGRTNRLISKSIQLSSILTNNISGYNRDTQETKMILMDYIEDFSEILEVFLLMIKGLEINKTQCKEIMTNDIFSAHKSNEMVEDGIPFREAYRKIKEEEFEFDESKIFESEGSLGSPSDLGLSNISGKLEETDAFWRNERERFKEVKTSLLN